ncbi:hypothetical protein HDV00_001364 [Rhizophlyctis rosea]|nr:hypothetical protein HDV00_001364 [Rhizophlyctis rosea]
MNETTAYPICLATIAYTVKIIRDTKSAAEAKHPITVKTAETLDKIVTVVVLLPFIYTLLYLILYPMSLWYTITTPLNTFLPIALILQRTLGSPLVLLYTLLHHSIFTTLHTNWSPLGLRTHQTLVTMGPYAYVRHPMYAAGWIAAIGYPLLVDDAVLAVLFVLGAVAAMQKAWPEERLLKERFGKEYEVYRGRVRGMFVPRFRI